MRLKDSKSKIILHWVSDTSWNYYYQYSQKQIVPICNLSLSSMKVWFSGILSNTAKAISNNYTIRTQLPQSTRRGTPRLYCPLNLFLNVETDANKTRETQCRMKKTSETHWLERRTKAIVPWNREVAESSSSRASRYTVFASASGGWHGNGHGIRICLSRGCSAA